MLERRWVLVVVVCAALSACALYNGTGEPDAGTATCGDGVLATQTEECDDGNADDGDACTNQCSIARCGDGVLSVSAGEECDDGNDDDSDECPSTCVVAVCGDGFEHDSAETCDDGNDDDADACTNQCLDARCGDGIVSTISGEECDDADGDDSDECPSSCLTAFCGDGFLHDGAETCDDGDQEPDNGCGTDCLPTVIGIDMGGKNTCVWTRSGAVKCWGEGDSGGNGYASTADVGDNETPSQVGFVDVGGSVEQLSAGWQQVCAVLEGGAARCWGGAWGGYLGYGNTDPVGDDETPASAGDVPVGGVVSAVAAGGNTCALLDNGHVRCWGGGPLGYGNTNTIGDDETPASVGDVDVGGLVTQLALGLGHACALLTTGNVRCWGDGFHGALGYGNNQLIGDDETPASAGDVDVGGEVIQIVAGGYHTCVLLAAGTVRCWGMNGSGQLGYGNVVEIGETETPASVGDVDVGGTVVQLAAGDWHTCALLESGAVRCWGDAVAGRLGYGNINVIGDDESPASAGDLPVGGVVTQIAADSMRTCALLNVGTIRCWGGSPNGELGYGNLTAIGDDETAASAGDVSVF